MLNVADQDFVRMTGHIFCYHRICLLLFIWLLLSVPTLDAQHLVVTGTDYDRSHKGKRFDSAEAFRASLESIYADLMVQGYLDARLDTLSSGDTVYCHISPGKRHQIEHFRIIGDSLLPDSGIKLRNRKTAAPFNESYFLNRTKSALDWLENNGYPFGRFDLDSLSVRDSLWFVSYRLSTGPAVRLDSLVIKSTGRIPYRYLRHQIGWRKGDLYNESEIQRIDQRLSAIPFIRITRPSEIAFREKGASVYIYAEKKKANSFNGVVGIQPKSDQGGVTLTGDLEIRLINAFQRGEEAYLNWRRLQSATQEMTIRTRLPFIFNTPFGTEGWLKIYRRDSTFTSLKAQLGWVFTLSRMSELKVFIEQNNTSRLSRVQTATDLANVRSTLYGIQTKFDNLDYRFNPRRGWLINMEGAAGKRKAERNPANDNSPVPTSDNNLFRIQGNVDRHIPTFRRQTIKLSVQGAGIFVRDPSENELFRIGGLKTLRGIDEEGIFARAWSVGTIEYRLLLEENSAIYLYADQGWYEAPIANQLVTDTPLGYGAGIFFETKAGIFTFNYGLARQFDNPVLLREARLSFGFRNLF